MFTEGLDHRFLVYIQDTETSQREFKAVYVEILQGCSPVVDLGCGSGAFVRLLGESGIEALGVDSDPTACALMASKGLPIVCADVLAYLRDVPPESLGGVFASHLIEHLPYPMVLELIQLAYVALRPGGKIVLTTPNVRGLFSHLEMFYMHFGHVTFYHPTLLTFFFDEVGFQDIVWAENAVYPHPLFADILKDATESPNHVNPEPVKYHFEDLVPCPKGWLPRLWYSLKRLHFHTFVQPYLDVIVADTNRLERKFFQALDRVDRPFDVYAVGVKK